MASSTTLKLVESSSSYILTPLRCGRCCDGGLARRGLVLARFVGRDTVWSGADCRSSSHVMQ